MKIAWLFLVRLKNKLVPILIRFGRHTLKLANLTWLYTKQVNSRLFQIILDNSRLLGKLSTRWSHQTAILLKKIAYHLGQYSIRCWQLLKAATRRFSQLCHIAIKAFRQAVMIVVHQIIESLNYCGHVMRIVSLKSWNLIKVVSIRLLQLCTIAFSAFGLAVINVVQQIIQFLKYCSHVVRIVSLKSWNLIEVISIRLLQLFIISFYAIKRATSNCFQQIYQCFAYLKRLVHSLLLATWRLFRNSVRQFIHICKIAVIAFRRSAIVVSRQLVLFVLQFQSLIKQQAINLSHIVFKVSGWYARQTIRLSQKITDLVKTIFYALLWSVLKLYGAIKTCAVFSWKQWLVVQKKLNQYAKLVRLDKPIGIFLLLWPALWALWIAAEGNPDWTILLVFIAGVILMRSAGCAINDFIDRNIDSYVSRTKERPLVRGIIQPREALDVAILLIVVAFSLVLLLNQLTILLSIVAVGLAVIYPYMKRITYLPQFFLGLAFAWSVPMAFAAETNTVPVIAWLLLCATVLWTVAYDTMYAMVDREDDISIGIRSTAILFDDADRFIIGCIQIIVLIALIIIGQRLEMSQYYYSGLAIAALFSVYQQFLIKDRIPENCFKAFLNNNWFGATVFAGIFLHYRFY